MARRRESDSGTEMLLDLFLVAPWWVGPVVATITYLALRFVPIVLMPDPAPGQAPQFHVNAIVRPMLIGLAPYAGGGMILLWLIAMVVRLVSSDDSKLSSRRVARPMRATKRQSDPPQLKKAGRIAVRLEDHVDLVSIRKLSWQEFEKLMVEVFKLQGYSVRHTGSIVGDGGVDLWLERQGERVAVQCKQWKAWRVGVEEVRQLNGIVAAEKLSRGILVTSGRFTSDAREFAERSDIDLIDGRALERLIGSPHTTSSEESPKSSAPSSEQTSGASSMETPGEQSESKIESVTMGGVSVPSCPVCGTFMVRRTATRGRLTGEDFWGCPRFPACRGKR